MVNEHLEVLDYPKVWAIGDCAEIINPETRQPYPPTVQHAVREGKVVAGNITASIYGTAKRTFIYKPLGVLVSLGRCSAVAEILGFRFSGFSHDGSGVSFIFLNSLDLNASCVRRWIG